MRKTAIILLTTAAIIGQSSSLAQTLAFPGAEGFGRFAAGGRGGSVIRVTNLDGSGPGSFRAACEASGPRVVIFDVAGIIDVGNPIIIEDPYLTIAGQTAPGDGICLRNGYINVKTHDVIIRGLRVRPGDGVPLNGSQKGILISNGAYRVIIDRCSVSWTVDQCIATWNSYANITIQNCILSEPLYRPDNEDPGAMGRGFSTGADSPDSLRMTYHGDGTFFHNLIAHSLGRNPRARSSPLEIVNNLIYNWGEMAARSDEGSRVDFIANHCLDGRSTLAPTFTIRDATSQTRVYVQDNISPERPEDSGNEWSVVTGPTQYRSFTRLANSGLVPIAVTDVFESVLDQAGAFPRDVVDQRIVNDVREGRGGLIYSQSDVGGWPVYDDGGSAYDKVDSDGDGMPDDWEEAHFLNPLVPDDSQEDGDEDGYTNIEEYINSFLGEGVEHTTTNASKNDNLPDGFGLLQNYPNPFNPTTTIRYNLEENSRVVVEVYDVLGRHVSKLVDEPKDAGLNEVDWNATTSSGALVTSGVYFYRLHAKGESGKDYTDQRKMFFIK